jgi:putative membrane protein insertion efficiency factor
MIGRGLLAVIGFYSRAISPALPARCRFHPTCSAYAAEAIERHGPLRGGWLALRRLVMCAPWHPGGVDLVPPARPAAQPPAEGTVVAGRSSTSPRRPSPAPDGARRPDPATPPAPRRANEESSVA